MKVKNATLKIIIEKKSLYNKVSLDSFLSFSDIAILLILLEKIWETEIQKLAASPTSPAIEKFLKRTKIITNNEANIKLKV